MSTDNRAVYLVVGGSGGIGAEVVRQLAAKGARVVASGRDGGRLTAIGAETLPLEARDSAAVDAALQQVHASHGRLDGVVNCAGSILLKPAHLITDAEFAETLALNLTTAALHPLGRIGEPAEVASAICWLLDRNQSWVTGQVIGVDGGLGSVQARA